MSKFKSFLSLMFALALIVLVGWLVWLGGLWLLGIFVDMEPTTRSAVLAFVGVLSVPLITLLTQMWLGRKTSREQAMREKRTEFYEAVIALFMSLFSQSKGVNGDGEPNPEWVAKMNALTPQMLLYASKDFIESWNRFRSVSAESSSGTGSMGTEALNRMIAAMEQIFVAARRDLGHRVGSGDQGVYASTFINDLNRSGVRKGHREIKNKSL